MHPGQLAIKDFTYNLPPGKIAKYPLRVRDESKLLVYKNGEITENLYRNIVNELSENTLLIFNNTKVVEARILFEKQSGGVIELFCLEPGEDYADITTAMLQKEKVLWKCLVGGAKKWKQGLLEKHIYAAGNNLLLTARKVEQKNDYFLIELAWNDKTLTFAEVLHQAGVIPLPPYLDRVAEENDKNTYQTIYAKYDGSVAAPTAGLHFTTQVFESFSAKNINTAFVTLHVGAGTFKPVKAATMHEHEMHAEFFEVSRGLVETIIANLDNGIIAVGTTSLRTIESLHWMGVKLITALGGRPLAEVTADEISVHQWDAYGLRGKITPADALQALLKWMDARLASQIITKTQIIIAPGYHLKIAKGLVTNFHQPQSTLLLLVAAVVGQDWRKIYDYALDNDFRFLSYGDGSLLFKRDS
ncbi:MAG TPA: S-adenosylmethionine:tRNA ribosyltransferase-isomerase [Chitinophagaceae bacterium]|nr:S-adenosylmethionine:tRNA ribosyltransferase-isomerase [Chitinophagaceae bacterium]